jgi:hypothetical protein
VVLGVWLVSCVALLVRPTPAPPAGGFRHGAGGESGVSEEE